MRAHPPEPAQHVARGGCRRSRAVACSSSTTTSRSRIRNVDQRWWNGRMPWCSISGFVSTHVRVLAGPGAVVGRGVAVVGDRAQPGDEPAAQRPQLVLRERLGREDQQRGVGLAPHDGVDDRQLVAERLARRGAGRDHHVLARRGAVDRRRPGGSRARRCRGRRGARPPRGATACASGAVRAVARRQRRCGRRPARRARGRPRSRRACRDGVRRGRLGGHRRSIARRCVRRPGGARPRQWVCEHARRRRSPANRLAAPGPRARLLPRAADRPGPRRSSRCAGIDREPEAAEAVEVLRGRCRRAGRDGRGRRAGRGCRPVRCSRRGTARAPGGSGSPGSAVRVRSLFGNWCRFRAYDERLVAVQLLHAGLEVGARERVLHRGTGTLTVSPPMSSTMPMKPSKSVSIDVRDLHADRVADRVGLERGARRRRATRSPCRRRGRGSAAPVSRGRSRIVAWCSAGFTPMRWIASPRVDGLAGPAVVADARG